MAAQQVSRAATWGEIAPRLTRAMGDDGEALRAEFEAGICTGWLTPRAALLTRVEGDELVIVAMQGAGLAELLPAIIANARAAGLRTMRAHTQRPGLLRLAQRIEPTIHRREIVLGLEL